MPGFGTTLPRIGRGARRLSVTGAVIALAVAALLGGADLIADRAAAVPPPPPAPITPVAVAQVVPQAGYQVTRRFIGQVEAPGRIDLGFELGGRIVEILAQEGDRVRAGAPLARLDTAALEAQRAGLRGEHAALAADAELARLTQARNDQLARGGFRSESARDDARLAVARFTARMASLDAQIAGVDIQIGKSTIAAPFDAVVGSRVVDPGQNIGAGAPVLRLFEQAAPQLRVGLPVGLASRLAPGGVVPVDIDGQRLDGRVLRLRADLDPVTRTRGIVVALPEDARLAFGQTGSLLLEEVVAEPGFWAPVAALREGSRGSWTVLAIAGGPAGETVAPAAVEVIHMAGDRVFLRGALADGARFVARAPARVAPGQAVAARAE
ncbi:efflux RND transporter periplasmic adaptor subunit [Roseomonas sp. CECT 9278]|uniref:efflux RND transporter periplasmic adaptor subunit n=1 Tax=Roseomonas sp. CECT 9278 TaxID=2845823 RepID=UPI001E55B845|nr:efflux RND transporter periplasmic adaptor subunit [Roseomonas sp. CECT 9278]CAH0131161.1 Multidrug resistance protein MdtA [Roseomonas sp. CECT 9278]